MTDDFEPEQSPLSQTLTADGKSVEVLIYSDGEGKWLMEIEDQHQNSTGWEDSFDTEAEALAEAKSAVAEEGIDTFIGPADGIGNEDGSW